MRRAGLFPPFSFKQKNMDCFDNLISIKTACEGTLPTPSSGLYIEDLGITCKEADFYINNDYASGQALIIDKIKFATTLVRNHIANNFAQYIDSKSLVDSDVLGKPQDSLQLKSGIVGTLGGISLKLHNNQSYFNVFVSSISLQISTTQDVPVLVYDLISGQLLDTFTVPCEANVITQYIVNKTYGSYKRKLDLIFVYDTEDISSNTTILETNGCAYCNGYVYDNYYIAAAPVYLSESAAKIRSSLTTTNHTFGLSVTYSVQCALDKWLCELSNLMAMPILWQTGIQIMEYATKYSKRQTSSVNIDAEQNQKRLDAYQVGYAKSINSTIQKMVIPKRDSCFYCEDVVKFRIVLP